MNPHKRIDTQVESKEITIRDRIGRLFWRCVKFKGKYTYSMGIVSLLVLLYAVAFNYRRNHDPVQVRFVENAAEAAAEPAADAGRTSKPVFSGEAHDTAQRLRECGALLLAISLSAFEDFRTHGSFPANNDALLTGIQIRALLPPGVEVVNGELYSSFSELKLNYRPEPFSFEILAMPSNGSQGQPMMFRFPLPLTGTNSVTYFESRHAHILPAPFSTAEQLAAGGWAIRQWRGETLPLDEAVVHDLQEHDEWLRSQIKK